MLPKLTQTLIGQLKVLTGALAIGGGLAAVTGWSPLFRIGLGTTFRGCIYGLALAIAALLVDVVLLRVRRSTAQRYLEDLDSAHAQLTRRSTFATIGAIIVATCGEEVLLRGVVFGWIAMDITGPEWTVAHISAVTAAFVLNAALSFSAHANFAGRRPANWRYAAVQSLIGTLLAFVFYRSHSLWLVLIARAIFELFHTLPLRSRRAIREIQRRSLVRS